MAGTTPTVICKVNPADWLQEHGDCEHGDYLFRYALSRLRDPEAAEKVVQETFVAGLRAIHQYSPWQRRDDPEE